MQDPPFLCFFEIVSKLSVVVVRTEQAEKPVWRVWQVSKWSRLEQSKKFWT